MPEGAIFSAKPIASETTDTQFAYDLKFTADDKEVVPSGSVTVTMLIPEVWSGETNLKVFHSNESRYENMNAKLDGYYLVFETDHFSTYIITPKDLENISENTENTSNSSSSDNSAGTSDSSNSGISEGSNETNPATGYSIAGLLGFAALAGAFAVVSGKKR